MKKLKASLCFVSTLLFTGTTTQASPPILAKPGLDGSAQKTRGNQFWWPDQLDLSSLRDHDGRSSPLPENFDYKKAFLSLDLNKLKSDINNVLTSSQDWWPADFGNYGPFFIRMSWHSAGTYRTLDGRGGGDGGQMRFDPLNSWPDNGNLDKARRLLWPIKKKYGHKVSWADLMILAGNVALENMGFKTYGFAGGRVDDWEPDLVYWGPETEMLASDRKDKDGKLKRPLGATHMGLIYVNPEGPMGKPDPAGSAKNIRQAFGRMAMNDEETVALIAGGHTFGKMHGAHKAEKCVGKEPAAAGTEEQGFGWKNKCGKGHSEDTVTSGLEGAWTQAPTKWSTLYLSNLLNNEWEQSRSPAGGIQWIPKDKSLRKSAPDAHVKGKMNSIVMTTADIALKVDPKYRKIAEGFLADPESYQTAFAKAWFKLTHRDLGPSSFFLGSEVPKDKFLWQDHVSGLKTKNLSNKQIAGLKKEFLGSGASIAELVELAWASASSFRASDRRGGANGARIALEPQRSWAINKSIVPTLKKVQDIQGKFNKREKAKISLADAIVLAGAAAIEKAIENAGGKTKVRFIADRADATQKETDAASFAFLEPTADAFRNYYSNESYKNPLEMMVDKADQLNLTVPEMTVLIGGLRVLGVNTGNIQAGVFTDKQDQLSNDFFVNLLDMKYKWQRTSRPDQYFGLERASGKKRFTATSVDLIFGSNSELRAVAEVYAFDQAKKTFMNDFVKAWTKVMRLDRFDTI